MPPRPFLSRFGEPRNSRRCGRAVRPRISPQGRALEQPIDFMPIVACQWFPIREPETGM
jgi:hypothetical protein